MRDELETLLGCGVGGVEGVQAALAGGLDQLQMCNDIRGTQT